ncbi:hypothetical protein GCM10022212_17810 [Actimicrobium antarcticum]|uniref:N-acetyltransferase domain-containing protein n=2 Tax=Actimicrobium antarcticum TaxID=1051899 RepID=A0ABP7T5P4_9BURK
MRGKGAGKQLMAAVDDWASARAADEIRLEVFDANDAAIAFYGDAGFGMQSHIMTKVPG